MRRRITVTLSSVAEPERRQEPQRGATAVVVLAGLTIAALLAANAKNEAPPPPPPVLAAAKLAVDPNVLRFTSPALQSIRVTNAGDQPLTIARPRVSNRIFAVSSDCTAPLAKDESCVVSVTLRPTAADNESGTLRIASNGGTAEITLIGSIASFSPIEMQPIDFGRRILGSEGKPSVITLSNGSSIALSLGTPSTAPPFAVVRENCSGRTIPPNDGCTLDVAFDPTGVGKSTGELRIPMTNGKLAAFTTLSGEAVAPLPQLVVPPIDFGKQPLGGNGEPRRTRLINTTNFALSLAGATTVPPFRVLRDGCAKATLQPGGACDVMLDFVPAAQGLQSGEVRIVNADGTTIARGTLTGFAMGKRFVIPVQGLSTKPPRVN